MKALFRAKRTDNGEWAYGNLIEWANGSVSIYIREINEMVFVDANTVGQYIGIHDNNNTRIFSDDIVVDTSYLSGVVTPESAKYLVENNKCRHGVVKYDANGDVGSCGCCYEYFVGAGFKADGIDLTNCCVAGNIHDDSDLVA